MIQRQIPITVLLLLLFFTDANCQIQNNTIVEVEGKTIVLFPISYSVPINNISGLKQFTPTIKQLEDFEAAFPFKEVNSNINKCGVRQVIGFIEGGKKYLLVHLLNTHGKRELKKIFPNWKNEFAIYFGGEEERQYSVLFKYSLENQTFINL